MLSFAEFLNTVLNTNIYQQPAALLRSRFLAIPGTYSSLRRLMRKGLISTIRFACHRI